MDFTNLVFGLSVQWHLVMMVTGQQIRMIKYKKQRTGFLLIPVINSPMLQHTVILSTPRRCCVTAHKHTIPKDVWPYPKVSERIKAGNCNEKSRTYTSMPEKTHIFNMTEMNDPKIWYHSRLENNECHHMIILDSGLGSDITASHGEQGRTMQLLHDHSQSSDNDCIYMSPRTNFIIL